MPGSNRRASGTTTTTDKRPARRLIDIATAADHLDVNPRTIRRYIAAGRLSGYRIGPRLVRVDLDEINDLARPVPAAGVA